jgi:hypothetical protein
MVEFLFVEQCGVGSNPISNPISLSSLMVERKTENLYVVVQFYPRASGIWCKG